MRVAVRFVVLVLALVGLGVPSLLAADPPYAGTWKLNPAKSNFGETTVTYEEVAGGLMKVTAEGQSYTFKSDGKEYPTPWGMSIASKAVDASTWDVTYRTGSKVVGTATMKLAADGKTLTVDSKNVKATGETSSDVAVYERLSGGPGLAGRWKTKNVKIGSPGSLSLAPSGPDGLVLTFVEEKAACSAKFDGKDHPATGPMWPPGWTCAIAKAGPAALDVTWKKDGKLMYRDTLTASADGKVLTDVGGAPGSAEKVTAVYDRQ